MEFKGILKERQTWVKVAILLAAGFMLYFSILTEQHLYVVLTAIVIIAVFFKKEHIISEKGVDIRYELFGFKSVSRWEWKDITAIKTDYVKAAPNVVVHIGKDVTIREMKMKRSDVAGIIELAKKMNPDIYIAHMTDEEREERDRQILRQQEIERGRNAAKKRKK